MHGGYAVGDASLKRNPEDRGEDAVAGVNNGDGASIVGVVDGLSVRSVVSSCFPQADEEGSVEVGWGGLCPGSCLG